MSIYTELTSEQMNQIQMDLMAGRRVSVPGPAAKEFARRLQENLDDMVLQGVAAELPNQI